MRGVRFRVFRKERVPIPHEDDVEIEGLESDIRSYEWIMSG